MKTGNPRKINVNVVFVSMFISLIFLCLCFVSCNPKTTGTDSGLNISFSKIYDKPDTTTYTAVDIKQTPDEGYIILGKIDENPYLLRINKYGDFLWDTKDTEKLRNYTVPVPDLLVLNREYYFFVYKEIIKGTDIYNSALLKLSDGDNPPEEVSISLKSCNFYSNKCLWVPLHATTTPDKKILILGVSYSIESIENPDFLLVKINTYGNPEIEISFKVPLLCILNYPLYVKDTTPYNFFGSIGSSENRYYTFQSYLNCGEECDNQSSQCFSIITMDPSDGAFIKDVHVTSPFIAIDGYDMKFSGARINNNGNFSFYVNTELDGVDIREGDPQYELSKWKPVYIQTMDVNDKKIVFFVGSSKDNRIVLYAYDHSNGLYLIKKYFGHTHIYDAGGLIKTSDNGLAILGTTYIVGRLGRICLFKLSKTELEDMVILP